MSRQSNEEEKRYRSLNAHIVSFVFLIMLIASGICFLLFNILDALGVMRHMYVAPMMLPFIALSACTIIGSVLTAMLSGLLLKPLSRIRDGIKAVSEGDYTVRLDVTSGNSEIASIQQSFNAMVQELQNTELFRNEFINDFSHEFKTPMVSVYGFAKQLKKGGLSKEQEREYIDIIISESQRLINMSSNILMLNRLENQEIISDKTRFSLDEEIRRSILLLESGWEKKNITVLPELDAVEYYGNPEMLRQVWLNVIGNAIKYTDENGRIGITLKTDPKNPTQLKIAVKDNGIGMDKATLERIFDKFYKGDASRASDGNGLGLAMVKRIITLCGGHIRVKSEPGAGTDFYIYLPIENDPEKEERKRKNIAAINTAALK